MRYQQLFASLAIRKKLAEGIKSGVVWHTQGSGKTALSYYLTYILNDFYSNQNKVAKFYFIVDRLDLLEQATQEFEARGLVVSTANTRTELMEQFRSNQAQQGTSGQAEITVVNIQRFAEDKEKYASMTMLQICNVSSFSMKHTVAINPVDVFLPTFLMRTLIR